MFSGLATVTRNTADQENKKKKNGCQEAQKQGDFKGQVCLTSDFNLPSVGVFWKKNIHFAYLTPYLPKYDGGNRYQRNDFPSADEGKA